MPARWLLAGVTPPGPSGGASRAHHVFGALARRSGARLTTAHGRRGLPRLALALGVASTGWLRPVSVGSTQLVPGPGLALLRGRVQAAAVDLHDHPVLQADALGVELEPERRDWLDRLFEDNVDAFERLVVPSPSFANLCGLPWDRCVVVTNGTDSSRIVPGPFPDEPIVALVSGAAPGRGIELLVEAMERVREAIPDAGLRLALSSTGPASAAYRAELVAGLATRPWVEVVDVPHVDLGTFLAGSAVAVVPHPPGEYYDASTPVKLFDSMAAGRPLVVTPRLETQRIVEDAAAGVVAPDDADGLGAAIAALLGDTARRDELGANARRAAEERYDWSVLGEQLADELLATEAEG